jgi:hypothetical protein
MQRAQHAMAVEIFEAPHLILQVKPAEAARAAKRFMSAHHL